MRPKAPTWRPRSAPAEDEVPPLPLNKSVIQVFSDYMKYLNRCAKTYISDTHGKASWKSLENDILYVLTHPNGWAGPQQNQMRQAAILGSLIPDTEDGAARVTFVTEGEASLHFCLSNGLSIEADDSEPSGVLIVDSGGGTIDLTSYRKLPNGSFTEIAVPQCYFQGGAYVTIRAKNYFEELLEGSRYSADVETLTTRFDRNTKHVFKSEDEPHHIQFASARERDSTLGIRGGRLTLAGHDVAKFFEPSVKCIIDAVKEQQATSPYPIKTAFLVGGFSASQWLYDQVRECIEPLGIAVSRPDTHVNKAVSNGAVSYYVDGAVSTRMSRLLTAPSTYGVEVFIEYDSTNPEHIKRGHLISVHKVSGKPILHGGFSVILAKGMTVESTQEFRRGFQTPTNDPLAMSRKKIQICSYVGEKSDKTLWVGDEPDKYPIVCTVDADITPVKPRTYTAASGAVYYRFDCELVLLFGLTELKAQIAYMEDGVEKRGPATVIYD